MSRFRVHRFWLILFCMVLLAGAAFLAVRLFDAPPEPEEAPPGWTVMVYMVGADLETFDGLATGDLREMREAVRGDTKLLVMTGGCPPGAGSLFGTDCDLYQVTADRDVLLETVEGSMGDPGTLLRLLNIGAQLADGPSALIFWDDGYGAMEGFGNDTRGVADRRLTLEEIAGALRDAGFDRHPLTVIGFDACLMAGCETALTLAPYASWLLASQETEPPQGWDYGFLAALGPEADGRAFGKAAIDRYAAYYQRLYAERPSDSQPYTLSLIDLSAADALASAAGALFAALDRDLAAGRFPDVSGLRQSTWQNGRVIVGTEYDAVDLAQLAAAAAAHPEAPALQAVMDRCVVARAGSETDAGGLSVFFPQLASRDNLAVWLARMDTLPLPEAWRSFVSDYARALQAPPAKGTVTAVPDDPFHAVLDDTGLRDFDRAKFYVLEGTPEAGMRLLYVGSDWSLSDHTVTVNWNRRLLALNTGEETGAVVSYLIQEDDRHAYHYSLAMVYFGADSRTANVRLRAERDKESGAWQVRSAIPTGSEPQAGKREIPLDQIRTIVTYSDPYRLAYDEEGRPLPWHEWTPTGSGYPDFLDVSGGFAMEEIPLPADGGPYWIQIVIADVYGRQYAAPPAPLN